MFVCFEKEYSVINLIYMKQLQCHYITNIKLARENSRDQQSILFSTTVIDEEKKFY